MGSIRSLATIVILGAVAIFLFMKINEAPMPGSSQQVEMAPGVPPLTGLGTPSAPPGSYDVAPSGEAPAWSPPPAAPQAMPGTTPGTAAPSSTTELPPIPAIPEMPDLPDLPAAPDAAPSATPAPSSSAAMPANVPTARYADTPSTPEGISGRVPSLGTATPNLMSSQTPPATQPPAAPGTPGSAEAPPSGVPNDGGLVAVDAASMPGAAVPPTPVAPAATPPAVPAAPPVAAQPLAEDNRYGESAPASATPMNATEKVGVSSFAEGWPVIQAALERGELARAHLLLSQWYEDPSLTPAESQQVDTLLSQLAGTVVYSTQHELEPAYVVQPGETLESIAQKYNVPWQLLAKINGIPAPNQVQPGQPLKVVRGPFSAVVELGRQQLTLMLDGRYAGKFPISVAPGASLPEGEWVVADKPVTPVPATVPYGTPPASMAAATTSRDLLLKNAANPALGVPLVIGSHPSAQPDYQQVGAGGAASGGTMPYLKVAPTDANELADILSVGSRVEIRR